MLDMSRCLENGFGDERMKEQRHVWSLSKPEVERHLGMSHQPSREVLSTWKKPSLGEERTGCVAKPRVGGTLHARRVRETGSTMGTTGEETEEGQGNRQGARNTDA